MARSQLQKQQSLIVLAAVLCIALVTQAGDTNNKHEPDVTASRVEILQKSLAYRISIQDEVITALRESKPHEAKPSDRLEGPVHLAIYVAGMYRFEAAIKPLLSFVESEAEFILTPSIRVNDKEERFPAVGALVKIGKPAADRCLDALHRTMPAMARENLCWVIGQVYGRNLAKYAIELKIKNSTSEDVASKYKESLQVIEALFPERGQNIPKAE